MHGVGQGASGTASGAGTDASGATNASFDTTLIQKDNPLQWAALLSAGNTLFAYLQANPDQSACISNAAISGFQSSFNLAASGTGLVITVDGLYGAQTDAALRDVLASNTFPPTIKLCGMGVSGQPAPNTSANIAAANAGQATTPAANAAAAASSSSTTLWLVAGGMAAVAIAVGGYVALKHHGHTGAVAHGRHARGAHARPRHGARRRRR
jgi:hypothetical protein